MLFILKEQCIAQLLSDSYYICVIDMCGWDCHSTQESVLNNITKMSPFLSRC
ncbi:hypothetical protein VCHA28FP16_100044 [Vibrio chagasii]|nr:hypothetical protein VCHA28FP16_100044 [Vibrio chagasii]